MLSSEGLYPALRGLGAIMEKSPKNEVGYCRPPKAHRFKKGQSGNPNGRPKGARSFRTIAAEVLGQNITVKENGEEITITRGEGVVRAVTIAAMKGDLKAVDKLEQWHGGEADGDQGVERIKFTLDLEGTSTCPLCMR